MQRKKRKNKKSDIEFKLPHINFQWPELNTKTWILLALTIVLLFVNFVFIPILKKPGPQIKNTTVLKISTTILDVLNEFSIYEEHITREDTLLRVLLPHDFAFFRFYDVLRSELQGIGANILDCRKIENGTLMSIGEKGIVAENILFVKSRQVHTTLGRAAIIIDDFGYSFNKLTRSFLTMQVPITISIIPGLSYSQKVAEIANLHGKQVLVHMPMEPEREKYTDEGFTLITGQDPGKVSLRLRQAFAQIPMAAGLNNHQGSKATADRVLMEAVMQSLKGLNKFFVDSRTSPASVAYQTAKDYRIPTGQNRIFLDAKDNKEFIRNQLDRMRQIAREQGSVIAIGHVRKRTLAVLQEKTPQLKASGITFVSVSKVLD